MSKITKLGLGIIAFEGTEHLKNIIYAIRRDVDVVAVCLQEISYHGDPIDQEDVDEINDLKEKGYVDEIIWFTPTNMHEDKKESGPRYIETDKRNFTLDFLENVMQCSHSLIIDSDEYYDPIDFFKAKEFINISPDIHVSYCQYINYYRDYRHIMVWPFYAYVPFITEAKYRYSFDNGSFASASDPTRRYLLEGGECTYQIMPFDMVKMHHLSWIRKKIEKKVDSWSSKKLFENVQGLRHAVLERYYNYVEGDNAVIMLNVPYFQVCVNRLSRRYIDPRYQLDDVPEPLKRK